MAILQQADGHGRNGFVTVPPVMLKCCTLTMYCRCQRCGHFCVAHRKPSLLAYGSRCSSVQPEGVIIEELCVDS